MKAISIIKAPHRLDADSVTAVAGKVARAAGKGPGEIRIDMSVVNYADSAGLGALILMWKSVDKTKNSLVLENVSEFAAEMLRNTNLERIFKC